MHLNVLRWCTIDFLLCHASNGVIPSMFFIGHLFRAYTAAFTASPQNCLGKPLAFNMFLVVATTVSF
jgi:hypothetical protein